MTKRQILWMVVLLGGIVLQGCGGDDPGGAYPQASGGFYESGAPAASHDPQVDLYRQLAEQQADAEYRARMQQLERERREWERQKNDAWAKTFTNPYDDP
ncbi:MAG TPA: hypothetical protein VHG28_06660 [Longimicrobiaceae bacterium]|nr:hypothetical protein [Longimicrobiaceae bacterium]